ncbi:alpha/beta fold hydrolase [Lactobacillus psittaci]|uniref:Alpha beta superfamily hydrolase n=1 Tax=Lactobacillus psittaci DSM 15354 TaxID=1122152 RepID=A0A0R1S0S7_9LACO|nr:alpha/beta hydrolase [Lactobacillus psittaci]KRL62781.1 alpha beta superfamily hydrolase [Lactobacillus psittaci DSM 15354]
MKVTVNNVDLYYQKLGQGEPLILLHGHHLDGSMFDKILSPLSLYYTVYVLDMRGHGLSSGRAADHYQEEVSDLAAFIRKLNLKQPYVYGFDAGGVVTLMLASQYPNMIKKAIVAGVFVHGSGIKKYHYAFEGVKRFVNRDPDAQVELTETIVNPEQLKKITTPVLCVVGEKDWVKVEHVRWYSQIMQHARLVIMPRQNHDSYTVHSFKMLDLIKEFCD